MTELVSLFFTALNLAVLFGVLGYGVYAYMVPAVRAGFAHIQKEQQKKHVAIKEARTQTVWMQEKIAQHKAHAQKLKDTVVQWKQVITHKQQEEAVAYNKRCELAAIRAQERAELRIKAQEQKEIMSAALVSAQKTLEEQFVDAKHKKIYIDTVLNIQKSGS